MERDDRREPAREGRVAHAAVVVERRLRELAVLGLDPAPLEREAIGVEAEAREPIQIVGVAMVVIAGVAARLAAGRALGVLPRPPVVVPVAAFDLMSGGGRAPDEARRKAVGGIARARMHQRGMGGRRG